MDVAVFFSLVLILNHLAVAVYICSVAVLHRGHDIPPILIFAIPIPNPNVNPGGLVVTTGGRNSVRTPLHRG